MQIGRWGLGGSKFEILEKSEAVLFVDLIEAEDCRELLVEMVKQGEVVAVKVSSTFAALFEEPFVSKFLIFEF